MNKKLMRIKTLKLSIYAFAMSVAACSNLPPNVAKTEIDTWSGTYRMEPLALENAVLNEENKQNVTIANVHITKLADTTAQDVSEQNASDQTRWAMTRDSGDPVRSTLSRFLLGEKDQYKDIGDLQSMYMDKKIECLDSGTFAICRTNPNTEVTLTKPPIVTKSGLFGFNYFHALVIFELYKIESPRRADERSVIRSMKSFLKSLPADNASLIRPTV